MAGYTSGDAPLSSATQVAILGTAEQESAFQRLSRKVPLSANGSLLTTVGQSDPEWVAETGVKPVKKAPITNIELNGHKLAKIVYMSEEFKDDKSVVANLIIKEAAPSLGRGFDKTVAGFITAPNGFDTLLDSEDVLIDDIDSFIDATIATGENQIVLNNALLAAFMKVKDTDTRERLVITDTTINGVPYVNVKHLGNGPVGFVGPFATESIWGVIAGSVKAKMSTEATINDNGTLVNLWQTNQIAYLVEGRYGFRLFDETRFSKIVTETVVDPED